MAVANDVVAVGLGVAGCLANVLMASSISKRVQPLEGIIWVQDVYKHFSKNQRPFN